MSFLHFRFGHGASKVTCKTRTVSVQGAVTCCSGGPWVRSPVKLDKVMLMNCISCKSGLLVYLGTVVTEVTNALQCCSSFEAEHPEETLISEQT